MAGRVGGAPTIHKQQLAPKGLRTAHGDGEGYSDDATSLVMVAVVEVAVVAVTTEVASTAIIVIVVHVAVVTVIAIRCDTD